MTVAVLAVDVAWTVVEPTATPVTSPAASTVALAGLADVQVTVRSGRMLPPASRTVAVSWTCSPGTPEGAMGVRAIEATAAAPTVTAALPLLDSAVAVMVAAPSATPDTVPSSATVAMASSEEVQATGRSVSVPPEASVSVAVSCTWLPISTVAVAGATATSATGRSPVGPVPPQAASSNRTQPEAIRWGRERARMGAPGAEGW